MPGNLPGNGSATLSWFAPSASWHTITGFLVSGYDQEPVSTTPMPWQSVAPGPGCATVTTTITGLTRGHRYGFWLEEVFTSPEDGQQHVRLVGSSLPVVIP